MTTMTGGAAVVEALRLEGVTHAFGLIGTVTLDILDELYGHADITYVGVRHEQNAAHMADGYARVSGRPGFALAGQCGPGATNLLTGIAQAQLAFSPVVALAGLPASAQLDTGTFQEVDQHAMFRAVTKKTFTVNQTARLPYYVRQAFRISESGRKGPVVINVPGDVLSGRAEFAFWRPEAYRAVDSVAPAPLAVARAAQLLNEAKRPLIIAGAGVKWARAGGRLAALAERLNAPVAASAGSPDVLPNDHPLYAGQVGPRGNVVATDLARTADVILALGTRLGFNTTFHSNDNISAEAKIIQVDLEPSVIGRIFPVALGVVADAGEMIDALVPAIRVGADRAGWVSDFQARRRALLESRAEAARRPTKVLHPVAVCAALQRAMPRDVIITLDTGNCALQSTDVLQTFQMPAFITPLDFGLVGFAYAAGLGAKAAAPERPVISIMGDGGFGMQMNELGTALQAGLNTVAVVMNNGCWGAEKAYQRDFFAGRYVGADIVNPAYDAVARAFGARGVRADTADDVTSALEEALRHPDRPTVIEVAVDPDALVSLRKDPFEHRITAAAAAP